jgi:hypothetical protein
MVACRVNDGTRGVPWWFYAYEMASRKGKNQGDAKKVHGGWRNKEGSRMALAAYRFNIADARKCSQCNRAAVTGSKGCRFHCGPKRRPMTEKRLASIVARQLRQIERGYAGPST